MQYHFRWLVRKVLRIRCASPIRLAVPVSSVRQKVHNNQVCSPPLLDLLEPGTSVQAAAPSAFVPGNSVA